MELLFVKSTLPLGNLSLRFTRQPPLVVILVVMPVVILLRADSMLELFISDNFFSCLCPNIAYRCRWHASSACGQRLYILV